MLRFPSAATEPVLAVSQRVDFGTKLAINEIGGLHGPGLLSQYGGVKGLNPDPLHFANTDIVVATVI